MHMCAAGRSGRKRPYSRAVPRIGFGAQALDGGVVLVVRSQSGGARAFNSGVREAASQRNDGRYRNEHPLTIS